MNPTFSYELKYKMTTSIVAFPVHFIVHYVTTVLDVTSLNNLRNEQHAIRGANGTLLSLHAFVGNI